MKEVKGIPVIEDFLVDVREVERLTLGKFLAHDQSWLQPRRGGDISLVSKFSGANLQLIFYIRIMRARKSSFARAFRSILKAEDIIMLRFNLCFLTTGGNEVEHEIVIFVGHIRLIVAEGFVDVDHMTASASLDFPDVRKR